MLENRIIEAAERAGHAMMPFTQSVIAVFCGVTQGRVSQWAAAHPNYWNLAKEIYHRAYIEKVEDIDNGNRERI